VRQPPPKIPLSGFFLNFDLRKAYAPQHIGSRSIPQPLGKSKASQAVQQTAGLNKVAKYRSRQADTSLIK
jgi:hypothetical protein